MKYWKLLKKSSTPDKRWLRIFIAEALFGVVIYYVGKFFLTELQTILEKLSAINLTRLRTTTSVALLKANNEIFQSIFKELFTMLAIALLVFVVVYTVFNIYVWATIANKKLDRAFIKRYLYTAIPIKAVICLIFLGIFKVYQPDQMGVYVIAFTFIALHLVTAMHIAIVTTNKKQAIKRTASLAFQKFHHFIMPYVVGIVVLFILTNLLGYITTNIAKPQFIFIAVFIIFSTWWRIYIYDSVQ